jgi:hypothetical protein
MDAWQQEINTIIPAKVQSWDSATETADVIPLVVRPGGQGYSVVRAAKVVFPGAYWDLDVGEPGLLLCGQWDFSRWWRTGSVGEPEQVGKHSLSSGVFIPGLRNRSASRNVPSGATVLAGDDVRLGVDSATEAVVRGDAYTGHEDTFLAALGVFLLAFDVWTAAVAAAVPPLAGPGGPAVTIQAASAALKTASDAFKGQLPGDLSTKVSVD